MDKKLHRASVTLLFLWITIYKSFAIVGNADVEDRHFEALASQSAFSGGVKVLVGAGFCGSTGSGVLLNNEWLVTAAHVVYDKDPTSISIQWNNETRSASQIFFTEEWKSNPKTGLDQGGDIAIIHLNHSFDYTQSTPLASGNLDNRFAIILGSGKGGNGVIGAFDTPKIRAASNVIDRQIITSTGGGLVITDFDSGTIPQNTLHADTVSLRYYDDGFTDILPSDTLLRQGDTFSLRTPLADESVHSYFPELDDLWYEGTTAGGDSGGGLFVFDAPSEQWQLAGLTSWGFNPSLPEGFAREDSRYGDVAFFTDISRHQQWIADTVPEPKTTLLLGLGFFLLRRHPRT
jgi:hypothetical protein